MTEVIRTGRPTNDPKQYVLSVRMNMDTKKQLDDVSAKHNEPVSELVRKYIETGLRQEK